MARGGPATAYGLLALAAFLWAANSVAGRWAPGHVSPQVITALRWAIACALLLPLSGRGLSAEWPGLRPHWPRVLLMGGMGYTAFASLFYAAGAYTGVVNLSLFQGAIPVMVIVLNRLVTGAAISPGQALGVALTLGGAGLAATRGDLAALATLALNRGDVLVFVGCLFYAAYTVMLPTRPKATALSFFTALALAALATSLPPLAVEWACGRAVWPSREGWAMIAFVGLGPSLLAQLAFLRGVELIGPNRAGLFVNLVPVFGAVLAVALVGEPFGPVEALALVLVLGGIACAERLRPAAPVLRPEGEAAARAASRGAEPYSQTCTRLKNTSP